MFDFRKEKQREMAKRGVSPVETMLKEISKNLEKSCKFDELENGILEIFEILNLNSEEIFKKYRYEQWAKLNRLTCKYLCNKYNIKLRHGMGVYVGRKHLANPNDCLGKTFEEYHILQK